MGKVLAALLPLIFLCSITYTDNAEELSKNSPRNKAFASEPGAYGLVIRVSNPIINPGEKLYIEVYISGYGAIESSKLAFYTSPEVFDFNNSFVWFDLKTANKKIGFGNRSKKLDPVGNVISFTGGRLQEGWEKPTMYFDVITENESLLISTETCQKLPKDKQSYSPVYLDLSIRKDARPGPQSVQFLFTYFNGEKWATSSEIAQFTVQNFYQRNEKRVWIIGVIAAVVTIISGIGPRTRRIIKNLFQNII